MIEHRDWMRLADRIIEKGDEVRVTGRRGAFRFVSHATATASGEKWVDVIHHTGKGGVRSVIEERVR